MRNYLQKTATGVLSVVVAGLIALAPVTAEATPGDTVRLSVEGISASLGEDEPRVLYILPWRAPSLPKRPRAKLDDTAPELMRPADPVALERHRLFRETLNPLILSPLIPSSSGTQP